jgi:mRNA interferase MazF
VIIQADDLLALSTAVICPTSRSAFAASFHPEVTIDDQPTQVLCEMVGAVDARALGEQAGQLTHDELRAVEDALLLVLDLGGTRRGGRLSSGLARRETAACCAKGRVRSPPPGRRRSHAASELAFRFQLAPTQ